MALNYFSPEKSSNFTGINLSFPPLPTFSFPAGEGGGRNSTKDKCGLIRNRKDEQIRFEHSLVDALIKLIVSHKKNFHWIFRCRHLTFNVPRKIRSNKVRFKLSAFFSFP